MPDEISSNTKIVFTPAQLWTVAGIIAAVVAGYLSLLNGQAALIGRIDQLDNASITERDWDMMLYMLQRNNPDSQLKLPTAAELRAAHRR